MTITIMGTDLPPQWQWSDDEQTLLDNLTNQINQCFPTQYNLLINTTWFGPQFHFGEYQRALELVQNGTQVDNLFLLSHVDPLCLSQDQINNFIHQINPRAIYKLGNFDSEYNFNWHAAELLPRYFKDYNESELILKDPKYIYLCYNRKPREHRVELVKKLKINNLLTDGIVSLGKNDELYSKTSDNNLHISLGETPDDYAKEGNWDNDMSYGIPHDIHSLGNMEYWQSHFLTVVSETEFLPWNTTFLTEKTFKPILGLRPFLLNGQPQIYKWLRDRGFCTFNDYFGNKDLVNQIETANELEIHNTIIEVLKYLKTLPKVELSAMYEDMLPALRYNKQRFFEFAQEQKQKINHLFLKVKQ